jgi:hypothetical protein
LFTSTGVTRMRRHLFASTGTLIAVMVLLPACGSSSKSSSSSGATTSPSTSSPLPTYALTCTTFAGKLTLSPPVSPTVSVAHKINVTGTLSDCTGTPGITSGDLTALATVSDKVNCAQLDSYSKPDKSVAVSIKWNNGTRSIGSEFVVSFETPTNFLISGKFDAGSMFLGKTATMTTLNTPDGGGCTTAGTSLSTATLALKPGSQALLG